MPCVTKECQGPATAGRGLCYTCYHRLSYYIRRGRTTWAILEAHRLCAKVRRARAPSRQMAIPTTPPRSSPSLGAQTAPPKSAV